MLELEKNSSKSTSVDDTHILSLLLLMLEMVLEERRGIVHPLTI